MSEPNWDVLLASIRNRYAELQGGSPSRIENFLRHVENLSIWEADATIDATLEGEAALAPFPLTLFVAFATCRADCGVAEFIVEGSTQECQRCGRLLFRHKSQKYRAMSD